MAPSGRNSNVTVDVEDGKLAQIGISNLQARNARVIDVVTECAVLSNFFSRRATDKLTAKKLQWGDTRSAGLPGGRRNMNKRGPHALDGITSPCLEIGNR